MPIRSLKWPSGCRANQIAFLLAIAALFVVTGCEKESTSQEKAQLEAKANEVPVVEVTCAELKTWPKTLRVHGSLAPDESAVLGAKVAGRMSRVLVDIGDVVQQGQAIAQLDELQLQLEVRHAETLLSQACAAIGITSEDATEDLVPENSPLVRQERAVLEQARLALDRAKKLAQESAATQEQLDEFESAYKVASARHAAAINAFAEKLALIDVRRAEVDVAKNALQESTIVAPFSGLIQQRMSAAGAYVREGDPVVNLVRCDRVRFVGAVPEKDAHRVQLGQQVQLEIRNEPGLRTVTITRFRPLIDPMSRALIFEADLQNPECKLRPGLFAEGDVIVEPDATAIVVPNSALAEFAGIEKVWRVVDGKAEEVVVETGERRDNDVVVLSGIEAGDTVVTDATKASAGEVTVAQSTVSRE
jgi:RND family efflux transporter MFP subunit